MALGDVAAFAFFHLSEDDISVLTILREVGVVGSRFRSCSKIWPNGTCISLKLAKPVRAPSNFVHGVLSVDMAVEAKE